MTHIFSGIHALSLGLVPSLGSSEGPVNSSGLENSTMSNVVVSAYPAPGSVFGSGCVSCFGPRDDAWAAVLGPGGLESVASDGSSLVA